MEIRAGSKMGRYPAFAANLVSAFRARSTLMMLTAGSGSRNFSEVRNEGVSNEAGKL
jgi:hypothetical protein